MGVLGLASTLGLTSPVANAALPYPLWINGRECSLTGADALSYRLRDPGFSGPQTFEFAIHDRLLAFGWLAKQQPVLWFDQVAGVPLFAGYVTDIRRVPRAAWVDIDVTCTHVSAALDYGQPVRTLDLGGSSDQAAVQTILGLYGNEPSLGNGGYVQVLNASMPPSIPVDRTTPRNAVDQVLAATGVQGAVCYIDNFGHAHTLVLGDIAAPYAISDTPNYTTTIPAAIDVLDQGAADVDALYVYGATDLGSGIVTAGQCGITNPPTSPLRWATLDAPQATDAAGKIAAATTEFYRRQNATTITLVVSGDAIHGQFDGWAKGQLLTVTNVPLGYAAQQFTISAVDMAVYNGKGHRRYTITAGSDPVLFTSRLKMMASKSTKVAQLGIAIKGKIGGAGA